MYAYLEEVDKYLLKLYFVGHETPLPPYRGGCVYLTYGLFLQMLIYELWIKIVHFIVNLSTIASLRVADKYRAGRYFVVYKIPSPP